MRTVISRAAVACLVFSALSVVLTGSPAQARSSSFESESQPLYEGCKNYAYSYVLDYPGASSFDVDLTLTSATNGNWTDYDYFSESGDHAEGERTFSVCDYEGAGYYNIEGTVTWYDSDFNEISSEGVFSDLHLTKRKTKTTLAVSDRTPRYNSVVRFTATSFDEARSGWVRRDYEHVALMGRCPGTGGWVRLKKSKIWTDERGKAVWRYRWNLHRSCEMKAITLSSSVSRASESGVRFINPSNRTVDLDQTSTRTHPVGGPILGR